jgi:hypothetical protein
LRRPDQRIGNAGADSIVGIDIGLKHDVHARGINRLDQSGKILLAVAQQIDQVALDRAAAGAPSASMARWRWQRWWQ